MATIPLIGNALLGKIIFEMYDVRDIRLFRICREDLLLFFDACYIFLDVVLL